ncbi:hypothetical protein M758_1G270800 [Ceratodon purpureus]|nr:hypothetical protein M758_1G270800 [Ceratodon purpureus]
MGFVFDSCTSEDLLVQQRSGWSGIKGRLRREDCEFVKHDKLFSNWKILVGPSDWSEHAAGKDGIDRYHLHNLPASHFGPGVYELGVTAPSWSPTSHSQRTRALKREDVMAVYVGQADNIRLRLQKYGQAGSHLEGSRSSKLYQGDDDSVDGGTSGSFRSKVAAESGIRKSNKGPRLFSEVFALGSSIAFRWAQTDSKVVAEQVESELLAVFDYAWNKGSNGNRRSRDILAKLFMAWPTNDAFCNPGRFSGKKWLFCGTNAVGIKVALRKPQDIAPPKVSKKLCHLLTAPPPKLPVAVRTPVKVASLELRCGVMTDKGLPCNAPPVRGRKRCLLHKGMRVRGVLTAGHPPLLVSHESSIDRINTSSVKRESVKVGGGSRCLPKVLMGRQSFFQTKTKTDQSTADYKTDCKIDQYKTVCNIDQYKTDCKIDHCKIEPKTECKEESEVRRRPLSLSFNTWMKMENERFHDSLDPAWSDSAENELELSFHMAIKQEQGHASGMSEIISKRRVRQIGSKYTSVPGDDSKRR